jgi:hypothetical protein
LYIKYKNFAGLHFFTVVGDPALLAQYQGSLAKPFYGQDGSNTYCTKDPEAALIQTGRLIRWKRNDGTIGWIHDLDQYRGLRDLAAKQPPSLVEFFMKQAIAAANTPIPEEYLEQLGMPVYVAPPVNAVPQVDPSDLDAVFAEKPGGAVDAG